MMMEPTCKTSAVHRLPAHETSWQNATADLLIAASLDGCVACGRRLSAQISRDQVNEAYGMLYTTFVLAAVSHLVRIEYFTEGQALPLTGLDLFPGGSVDRLHPQTRRVLSATVFPPVSDTTVLGVTAIGMPDGEGAARVLRSMSRQDREAVLEDVLDLIVGGILASQLFSMPPGS